MILQIGYAAVLAFMLLAHRNDHRRQMLRIPLTWATRVRLARMMRDINDRVGHYLFALAVIYACVAVVAAGALALLGFPNAIMWGIVMGLASFVPFVGAPLTIGLVALVALISFDDWLRIVGAPLALLVIHFAESQFVTPAFVSRRCALNTVAVFVTIALLGWMWGAIGAIVAVPLLILLSTIAAHLPSLRWLEVMLSDDRPVSEKVAQKPALVSVKRPPVKPAASAAAPARGGEVDQADQSPEGADDRPGAGRIDIAGQQDQGRVAETERADRNGGTGTQGQQGTRRCVVGGHAQGTRGGRGGRHAQEGADHGRSGRRRKSSLAPA